MAGDRHQGALAARIDPSVPLVLVVEDEPDIASFLGAFFRASGLALEHIAPEAADDVVAAVAALHPACVLLDLRLGRFTGFDVLAAMADAGQLPDLPVVVLSGSDAEANRDRALAHGAVAFLPKPFSVREVFGLVGGIVGIEAPAPAPKARPRSAPVVGLDADVALTSTDVAVQLAVALAEGRRRGVPVACALVLADGAGPALPEVAEAVGRLVRGGQVLAAGAADQLVLVAPDHDAGHLADLLGGAVADVGLDLQVALKAGVAASPQHGLDGESLLQAARGALTAAISHGPVATAR